MDIKYKFKNFYNKNRKTIGILFLLLSFILMPFNYCQSKVDINYIKENKINNYNYINKVIDKENNLGKETYNLLVYKKYDSLIDLKNTKYKDKYSIGDKKYKILKKYFKVGGLMLRPELYYLSLIVMIILNTSGLIILLNNHIKFLYSKIVLGSKMKDFIDRNTNIRR